MSEFIKVGVTAMRDPMTGELLESVPLYVRSTDAGDQLPVIDTEAFAKEIIRKIRDQKIMEKEKAC